MNCPKKYFTNQHDYAVRLAIRTFEAVNPPIPTEYILTAPLPFIPLAWTLGGASVPSEFTSIIATAAAQDAYRSLLEGVGPACALASSTKPLATINGVTCNRTPFEKYFDLYLGGLTAAGNDWAQNGNYLENLSPQRMPGAMVAQFWRDENLTPVPSTLYDRLWELCWKMKQITDPRLWAPAGEFSFVPAWGGEPVFTPPPTIEDAFLDPTIGNSAGLSLLVLELKSIE